MARLTYASAAWWGLTSSRDRDKLDQSSAHGVPA